MNPNSALSSLLRMTLSLLLIVTLCIFTAPAFAQQPTGTNYGSFSGAFAAPYLSGVGATTLTYSAGTLYEGGLAKSITAGTIGSLDASQSSCAAPAYSACEFIYWASGTGLSKTTSYATALGAGVNVIVGYLTTNSGSAILTITPASLDLPMPAAGVYECGTSAACSPSLAAASDWSFFGSCALSSASPSTCSVSAMAPAFTSSATYWCTASPEGTTAAIAAAGIAINKTSGSAFTLTGPNTVTTVIDWRCTGH